MSTATAAHNVTEIEMLIELVFFFLHCCIVRVCVRVCFGAMALAQWT